MKTMPVNGKFEPVKLAYADSALHPVISSDTIGYHYGKHLMTYINNLNNALKDSGYENMSLEDIVRKSNGGVFNNAGQALNHIMYFSQFCSPRPENAPSGRLADAITTQYGSFDAFKAEFLKAGTTLFGSGWVWLSADDEGKLLITQEYNAGNPLCRGLRPLLTADVWEHAYYLDYQNRRPDYLSALWQIIDWDVIEKRFNG